uniref:G-protein coupled receptors family 1 profile domain-containing protein n=1 Tax=Acrobeloides nanus TaxID=290746 RepID=A0A914CYF1_9BILA
MSNSTSTPNNYSYFTDPAYQGDIRYTIWTQIYYIGCGFLAAFLNLYLIFLFVKYPKLKDTPCNWIIIQQCFSEVLMGYGTVMRAVTFLFATNFTIMNFDLSFCFWVGGLCSVGYRIGQTIALLMAVDRLLAIWKPGFYATRHVNVTFKKSWFEKRVLESDCSQHLGHNRRIIWYNIHVSLWDTQRSKGNTTFIV